MSSLANSYLNTASASAPPEVWRSSSPAARALDTPPAGESLASVTPRVLHLAHDCSSMAQHIAQSLGLVPPMPAQGKDNGGGVGQAPVPTLMSSLCQIEQMLDFVRGRLEQVGQHING